MDVAMDRIKQLAENTDEAARRQLVNSLHKLAYSMESPQETIHRFGHSNLQSAIVKTGFDLGIFQYMTTSASGAPVTVEEIANKTGTQLELTNRLLRYLASVDVIDEVSKDQYAPNHITYNLAQPAVEAGVSHFFCTVGPQYQALPTFLQKTGYKSPTDEMHTAFQEGWNTSENAFSWFADHPDHLAFFNDYMALRRQPELSWLTVYPVSEQTLDWDPERAVYVNVGGGIGHQCAHFKEKYPDVPGRVVLQDMPHSIAQALPTPGVENMVHDFFEPQPIHGAKFYFLRGVLHDHPPHKVRKLLEQTKAAMAPDSIILIDEMILPETGVNSDVASIDMTMLTACASKERTQAQWREAVEDVGLELVQTYTYNPLNYESVMEVRLSQQCH